MSGDGTPPDSPSDSVSDTSRPSTDSFLHHRNLLFTVGYEMLGSATDAEDVLQEVWLRWDGVDHDQVRDHRAYLIRITTRQALNRLRSTKRRKENYFGPWLPEPLRTAPDVADNVELAESVSMAILLVLETLSPIERAVFVLREVFDVGYEEIAAAVGKSNAAVRQIAHRARQHVAVRRPRQMVSHHQARRTVEAGRRALEAGDVHGLLEVLAPDAVLITDGGGETLAAVRPVVGADKVSRFIIGGTNKAGVVLTGEHVTINGNPALLLRVNGNLDGVLAFRLGSGRITGAYYVRNPEKLAHLDTEAGLSLR